MQEKEREKTLMGTPTPSSSSLARSVPTPASKRKEKLKPDLKLKCGACGQVNGFFLYRQQTYYLYRSFRHEAVLWIRNYVFRIRIPFSSEFWIRFRILFD
jgi:hypothetical protein